MAYFIVGKMKVSGTNQTTGKPYNASNIYLVESITSQYGEGNRFVTKNDKNGLQTKLYVPDSVISYDQIIVNKKCEVSFDQYGNIKGIQF